MIPVAINLDRRLAIWSDGSVTPICGLFDDGDEEPDEVTDAVWFTTKAPGDVLHAGLIQSYPQFTIH